MLAPINRVCRIVVNNRNALFLLALLGGCLCGIFALQPFGNRSWAVATVSAVLAATLVPNPLARRLSGAARKAAVGVLGSWLGLIAWSAGSPGGPMPTPKTDPAAIRVLTWNVLLGNDAGVPWLRHDWPVRKLALRSAIRAARPDILCVQEALEGQVEYLEATLPGHRRVGAGRDDGRSAGEHCAIYFDADRFEPLGEGTFWLEEPKDEPPRGQTLGPKRICSSARLRDRPSGRVLRVYNTHLYLTERARIRACRIIMGRIAAGDPTDAVLVAGDFNSPPLAPSRRIFAAAGLFSLAGLVTRPAPASTYQFYGIRLKCLDDIILSQDFEVRGHSVVDVKPGNTFPSDHFGILADITLSRKLDAQHPGHYFQMK